MNAKTVRDFGCFKGPGYFEAYRGNPDGTEWSTNWNAPRDLADHPGQCVSENKRTYTLRVCYVPAGKTAADVLDFMNGKVNTTIVDLRLVNRPAMEQLAASDLPTLRRLAEAATAEVKRVDFRLAEEAEQRRIEERNEAWRLRRHAGLQGFDNFLKGVIHALACDRQMRYSQFGSPVPVGDPANMGKVPAVDLRLSAVAEASIKYVQRGVRGKNLDPVDAKPPWLRTAQEHYAFKVRQMPKKKAPDTGSLGSTYRAFSATIPF